LGGADLKANIQEMVRAAISEAVRGHLRDEHGDDWDVDGLIAAVGRIMPLAAEMTRETLSRMSRKEIDDMLLRQADELYEARENEISAANMRILERLVMLRAIDTRWIDHLTSMENMRQGVGLQALAQRDPLVAYKRLGHEMFQELMDGVQQDIVHTIFRVGIVKHEKPREQERGKVAAGARTGRNDPCPCGSGRKYKKCCGK
ncbi:MAG: SEC-C domain-containing protein, partial [Dehalococcoidia bacterium]|nr:SEC-C domain-containing protein [Dehalococcoidia bacterium]